MSAILGCIFSHSRSIYFKKFSGGPCPRTPLGRLRLRRALQMPSPFYLDPQSQKFCTVPAMAKTCKLNLLGESKVPWSRINNRRCMSLWPEFMKNAFKYKQLTIYSSCQYVWVIDQVWGQDGWMLTEFFFCVFLGRDGVEVHTLAKTERGQYSAILAEQAWSIQDLLYGFRKNFPCGTPRVVPSGQDSSILPARVANHSAGFDSSCPFTELAI